MRGTRELAMTPRGTLAGEVELARRAVHGERRARMLARPVPPPDVASPKPRPLSRHRCDRAVAVQGGSNVDAHPPSGQRVEPVLDARSRPASAASSAAGRQAAQLGGTSMAKLRRRPIRICWTSRYACDQRSLRAPERESGRRACAAARPRGSA